MAVAVLGGQLARASRVESHEFPPDPYVTACVP
jgi:hypothetical protein